MRVDRLYQRIERKLSVYGYHKDENMGGDRSDRPGAQLPDPAGHAAPGMPVSGPLQGQRLWTWGRCDRSYPGAPGSGYAGGGLCQRGGGAAAERGQAAHSLLGRDPGGADPPAAGAGCDPDGGGSGDRPKAVRRRPEGWADPAGPCEAGHRHEPAGLSVGGGPGGGDGGRDRPAVPPARSGGRGPVYPLCGRRRERGLYYGPV